MKNRIGVMQGRLLPKYKNQYQAHPVGYWQDEFFVAASMGLNLIEFIVDLDGIEFNPLMSADGIRRINEIVEKTGVGVSTVCADCFMAAPLHSKNPETAKISKNYLHRLISNASQLHISDIVIPCVDQSSLQTAEDEDRFVAAIESETEFAEENKINLSLETDLSPTSFARLLERINSDYVTVNYDTGNSASMGYDPREELAAYGSKISDIHLKDRVKGGGSVLLGTGNADFDRFFEALSLVPYNGPFIFQAYRDDEGLEVFKSQLQWMSPYLTGYAEGVR